METNNNNNNNNKSPQIDVKQLLSQARDENDKGNFSQAIFLSRLTLFLQRNLTTEIKTLSILSNCYSKTNNILFLFLLSNYTLSLLSYREIRYQDIDTITCIIRILNRGANASMKSKNYLQASMYFFEAVNLFEDFKILDQPNSLNILNNQLNSCLELKSLEVFVCLMIF